MCGNKVLIHMCIIGRSLPSLTAGPIAAALSVVALVATKHTIVMRSRAACTRRCVRRRGDAYPTSLSVTLTFTRPSARSVKITRPRGRSNSFFNRSATFGVKIKLNEPALVRVDLRFAILGSSTWIVFTYNKNALAAVSKVSGWDYSARNMIGIRVPAEVLIDVAGECSSPALRRLGER
jgi:hypothetical protein